MFTCMFLNVSDLFLTDSYCISMAWKARGEKLHYPWSHPVFLGEKPCSKHWHWREKSSQKVAKSQGVGAALTHGQCLSADGRRKACSMSIFAKLLLCVYLCKAVCVCFLYTEVFEVRSEPPINDFYKSEGPAGPAERCLLAISWITNFISKYYPRQ